MIVQKGNNTKYKKKNPTGVKERGEKKIKPAPSTNHKYSILMHAGRTKIASVNIFNIMCALPLKTTEKPLQSYIN